MTKPKTKPRNGPLDARLGGRLKDLRARQGESQSSLGAKVGLTFQQIQKYENGSNRISALMLVKLAEALNTTPSEFLAVVDEDKNAPPSTSEVEQLVLHFEAIESVEVRASVLKILAKLAK